MVLIASDISWNVGRDEFMARINDMDVNDVAEVLQIPIETLLDAETEIEVENIVVDRCFEKPELGYEIVDLPIIKGFTVQDADWETIDKLIKDPSKETVEDPYNAFFELMWMRLKEEFGYELLGFNFTIDDITEADLEDSPEEEKNM